MITLCLAAKGGSGTTVIACTQAIHTSGPTLLVDLCGDVPAVLGHAESDRPGVADWLASRAPIAHLDDLVVDVAPDLRLLPMRVEPRPGDRLPDDPERWKQLLDWLTEWTHDCGGSVVIDAGTHVIPSVFVEACPTRWLVTRPCFLSLRRAVRLATKPTGVVLVVEPGRALGRRDVERAVGAPVVARVAWDAKVARATDCGLMNAGRLSRTMVRDLARAAA